VHGEPALVGRARALAERLGFEHSCRPEVGRLLHVLAAERGRSRVAEIGTGCGVGTAWMASALAPAVPLVTAEADPALAAAAARLFRADPSVRVLPGDWRQVLPPEAPFDLVFADGGRAKEAGDEVLALLTPGGTVVIDDLTPGRPGPDPVREFWLERPDVAATELLTTPVSAAIVAVRVL
jgi:predicted O-methyltransferase YrrM